MNTKKTLLTAMLLALLAAPVATAAESENSPEIMSAVKTALNEENVNSFSKLEVEANTKGVVWLKGTVESNAEADRAVAIAKAVPNLTSVNILLEVVPQVSENKSERSAN